MSTSLFEITVHTVPAQHIREYRYGSEGDNDELKLSLKQYRPLNNPNPQPGDVTIIAAHANGLPKETYEPLWDDILARADNQGIRIRSIWIADTALQGESSIVNQDCLGNDPSWFDHPRDLLSLINHFRAQMPRPLVGIGHSMGGHNIAQLSLLHPRLFHSVILLDPVIQRKSVASTSFLPAYMSMMRRDVWPDRSAAVAALRSNPFYKIWDPRALSAYIDAILVDLPTRAYPANPATGKPAGVTLRSTKFQEVLHFFRYAHPDLLPQKRSTGSATPTVEEHISAGTQFVPTLSSHFTPAARPAQSDLSPSEVASALVPDMVPSVVQLPFYRPEPLILFFQLPHLRPSCLYVFGETSSMSTPEMRRDKMHFTGTGVGGSGGAVAGRVKEVVVPKAGHMVPFEKVGPTADAVVDWLATELARWKKEEELLEKTRGSPEALAKVKWLDEYEAHMKRIFPADKLKEAKRTGTLGQSHL